MTRIRLGERWSDFVDLTTASHQYPEIQSRPTARYISTRDLRDAPFSFFHFAYEMGLRSEWVGPPPTVTLVVYPRRPVVLNILAGLFCYWYLSRNPPPIL